MWYGPNYFPLKFICWKSQPPVPETRTILGDRASKEVIKIK